MLGPQLLPISKNGANIFVLPLKKMVFRYHMNNPGSSFLKEYLRSDLPRLAADFPTVEFVVQASTRNIPFVAAQYINKNTRTIGLRKLPVHEIRDRVKLLCNSSGAKPLKFSEKVISRTAAIRPLWSPFHDDPRSPLIFRPKSALRLNKQRAI